MTKKSIVVPVQKLKFLGFLIDSVKMVVTMPVDKIDNTIQEWKVLLKKQEATIREVAKVIGILVSVFQAVEYGPLHYRNLELQKIDQLKNCKGNYNLKMRITNSMKTDWRWWLESIQYQYRNIDHVTSEMVITTDASLEGWGAVYNDSKIGGRWNETERVHHINYLELLAVFHAIKSFCKNHKNTYVGLRIDNTCTIAYINNMGGIKSVECNSLAYDIWYWCINRDI